MTYLAHFGLASEPFSTAPAGRFFFPANSQRRVLVRIQHAMAGMRGLCVVSGEIGLGKTSLARHVMEILPEAEYEASLLVMVHSEINASWLLSRIARQVGVQTPAEDRLKLLGQLFHRLNEIAEAGKKTVVLIDEAQMLRTREIMEEFRGLLNLELSDRKLITFVFFGLPEVEKNLLLDPPLRQRVAVITRLEPLDKDSTDSYILHRLKLAGCERRVFSPAASEAVFALTRGFPRLVNTVCDNAMLETFMDGEQEVGHRAVLAVARALGLDGEAGVAPLLVSDGG